MFFYTESLQFNLTYEWRDMCCCCFFLLWLAWWLSYKKTSCFRVLPGPLRPDVSSPLLPELIYLRLDSIGFLIQRMKKWKTIRESSRSKILKYLAWLTCEKSWKLSKPILFCSLCVLIRPAESRHRTTILYERHDSLVKPSFESLRI